MQPILCLRSHLHHLVPLGQDFAQFSGVDIRYPDRFQKPAASNWANVKAALDLS